LKSGDDATIEGLKAQLSYAVFENFIQGKDCFSFAQIWLLFCMQLLNICPFLSTTVCAKFCIWFAQEKCSGNSMRNRGKNKQQKGSTV